MWVAVSKCQQWPDSPSLAGELHFLKMSLAISKLNYSSISSQAEGWGSIHQKDVFNFYRRVFFYQSKSLLVWLLMRHYPFTLTKFWCGAIIFPAITYIQSMIWWLEQLIKSKSWPGFTGGWQGLQSRAEGSRSCCRMCCLGSRGCNTGDPQQRFSIFWLSLELQAINEAASQAAGGDNKNRYIRMFRNSTFSW